MLDGNFTLGLKGKGIHMSWFTQNWSKRIVALVSAGKSRFHKNPRRRGSESRRPDRFRCCPALMNLEERTVPSIFFQSGTTATTSDNNGPLITHPHVELVFWGPGWNVSGGPVLRTAVENAVDSILTGPYMSSLSQYRGVGSGSRRESVTIPSFVPNPFTVTDVDNMLRSNFGSTLPDPLLSGDSQLFYFVVPQPQSYPTGCGCSAEHTWNTWTFWPYHFGFTQNDINLATITRLFSHEQVEAATDPEGTAVQVNPRNPTNWNEIADGAAGNYTYRLNGYYVQAYLSQANHAYVVPTGQLQNFYVSDNLSRVLTVNGDQLANPNDTITIDVSGGGVRVTLNGEVAQFDPGQIGSIVVNTGNGNDTVNIEATPVPVTVNLGNGNDVVNLSPSAKNLANIQNTLTLNGNVFSSDALNVFDQNAPGNLTYSLSSATFSRTSQVVLYSGMSQVTINGSNGANTYRIDSTRGGTPPCLTTLNTGTGSDEVDVRQTFGPLVINEQRGGNDTVNISPAERDLGNIQGNVTIHDNAGVDTVNVNDQSTSTGQTFTMNANTVQRSGSALISYGPGINFANINGGTGNNIYNVNDTESVWATTLNTGTGHDTVNVEHTSGPLTVNEAGSAAISVVVSPTAMNLNNIQGTVTVTGNSGQNDTLTLHDDNNNTAQTYTLNAGSISRTGMAGHINYGSFSGFVYVNAYGISAGSIVNVGGTIAHSLTTVGVAAGNNTVNVEAVGPLSSVLVSEGGSADISVVVSPTAKNLNNIQGTVTVTGNGGQNDTLTLHDDNNNTAQTYTLNAGSIGRTGMAGHVNYGSFSGFVYVNAYGISAGSVVNVGGTVPHSMTSVGTVAGNIRVNVETVGPLSSVSIYGNGPGNVVNISPVAQNLINIQGSVNINNAVGSVQVNINDGADRDNHPNALLSLGRLTGLAPAAINFDPSLVNNLTINDGQGNDVYTITGCPLTTVLNAGPGTDAIHVQGLPTFRHLTVNTSAGSGADTITLGDAAQSLSGINSMQSSITLNGRPGDTLLINDQGYAGGRGYFLTPTTLTWTFGPQVSYSGLTWTTLNGSQGGNTFDLSGGTAAYNYLALYGGGGSNQLIGSNNGNTWLITGPAPDTGYLQGPAYGGSVSFYHLGNLTGGTGGDMFQFFDRATLSGSLTGRPNTTLDYSQYSTSVIVDLQTGFATGVGGSVSGISSVIGGSGAPGTAGLYNLLIGNGNNTLTGGTGRRNILVAGGSASTLNAGDGEDLLIGGTTMYDGDTALASWRQIADYWAGTDNYFTRVANLTTGNGVPLLDASTVSGNGGGNTMNGSGGLALIYTDGADFINGFDPNSQMVSIAP
jgi:hypothetical protein